MGIKDSIINKFKDTESFTMNEAYKTRPDKDKTSIRARIYEGLGINFQRISKGLYQVIQESERVVLIEGDGRDLSFIENGGVDCIITDHPWDNEKSNKGGNRSFADYDTFIYTQEDFNEKARVLKDGAFLVEFLPAENEDNFDYLYNIKKMAERAGLLYYSKVAWKKGDFVANTGRKAKNTEDVMIFTKGKPRALRADAKKDKAEPSKKHFMSGTNKMLPTEFDFSPPSKTERIHQAEKPVPLVQSLLDYFTLENEVILDQFAGSGVLGEACKFKNRKCILIEKSAEVVASIQKRLFGKQHDEVKSLAC